MKEQIKNKNQKLNKTNNFRIQLVKKNIMINPKRDNKVVGNYSRNYDPKITNNG